MARAKSFFRKSKRSQKKNNSKTRKITGVANKSFASAEVIDVILEDTHPDYNPQARLFIGTIKARQLEHEFGVPDENLSFYRPYFGTGIWVPPLIGEIVTLIAAAGKSAQRDHKVTEMYYLPPLNIWQDVNNNQLPGSSYRRVSNEPSEAEDCNPSGQYTANPGTVRSGLPDVPLGKIFEAQNIQRLFPYEGDVILEGRSGHSIRLASTVKGAKYPNWWSDTGENGDPITIISDGHSPTPGEYQIGDQTYDNIYKVEDPNNDGSIIVLTCTQTIPIDVPSVIGNNIRQDSYGNVPKIPTIGVTPLDYSDKIDKATLENKETPVDDRDQDEIADEEEDGTTPTEDDDTPDEESNTDDEITDILIGGYLAYLLAGKTDVYNGWSIDIPQGTYGKYKRTASVKDVYQACIDYPGDLTGKTVILDSAIASVGWADRKSGLGARIIHMNKFYDKQGRLKSALPIYLEYDGSIRYGGYRGRSLDAGEFRKATTRNNLIRIDDTKPQWPRQLNGRPELNKDRVLDKSDWNVSQTYDDLRVSYFNRLRNPVLGGAPKSLNQLGNDNTIVAMMKILKDRGAAEIKLLGVGDYFDTTPGYEQASMNRYLQSLADEVDIATFVGGYEMKTDKIFGGEPKDIEAYKAQINGEGAPPAEPPPPSQKGQRLLETYKGINIVLYTQEDGSSRIWLDSNQTENPPFSTEIKTAAEINIAPLQEIDKGYWFELEMQDYEITGKNGFLFRTIGQGVELFKEDLDIAIEDWEDPIL